VVCQLLPLHHRHVFDYIMAFAREIVRFSAQNGVDPKILATLFARILLRDPPGTDFGTGIKAKAQQQFLDQKKARFIYHFLVNDPEID
jgi:phosphatidylinositol-bisphosphatase